MSRRYLEPARMFGVDLSQNAVEFCRTVHSVLNLEFRQGDAEHLPFEDASFDAVLNVESSHCYPSLPDFFTEVRRVLKNNGCFLYADLHDASTANGVELSAQRASRLSVKRRSPNMSSAPRPRQCAQGCRDPAPGAPSAPSRVL